MRRIVQVPVDRAVPYSIRRSDRARHARIVVEPDGVEVVVPRRMALRHVAPFVERKRPWIERTLRRLRAAEAAVPAAKLADGGRVRYLDRELSLAVRVDPGRRRAHVRQHGDLLSVRVGASGEEAVREALERWYRVRAREEVDRRLRAAAARAGTSFTRLSIRSQRSRWASCSSRGAMSFNWRLLLAPAEILDYVVEHEVVHLTVHDHSRRFWALLEQRYPTYRAAERWLKLYGPTLRL